jgi:hypothetical protein
VAQLSGHFRPIYFLHAELPRTFIGAPSRLLI